MNTCESILLECFTIVQMGWESEEAHNLYDKAWEFIRLYGESIKLKTQIDCITKELQEVEMELDKKLKNGWKD